MPPKMKTKSRLDIEDILSHQYDPADYSLAAFHEQYQVLVEHRDNLRKQFNEKEERRASHKQPNGKTLNLQIRRRLADPPSANPSKGSRFSILPDDGEGSSTSAASKPTTSATLSKKQLDNLLQNDRKVEVRKIKGEIETMKKEMKAQKKKDNKDREEAQNTKEKEHRRDEADESGQDQDWETAKS